jgi:hypothetical protein
VTATTGTAGIRIRRGDARWLIHLQNAAKGAIIIGAAVVLGIILLQVIDDGGGSGGGSVATPSDTTATTSDDGGGTETPTDTSVHDPAEVKIVVLNGSGVAGAAAATNNLLLAQGYADRLPPGDTTERTGTVVQCQEDYIGDGQTIATILAQNGTVDPTVEPYPDPVPTGAEGANCIVILGAAAS